MNIQDAIDEAYKTSREHGFWPDDLDEHTSVYYINTKLLLMVGEISEAQEALRKENPFSEKLGEPITEFEEELADLAIRLFDFCGWAQIDLAGIIRRKMDYNANRPHKHGKAF